MEANNKKVAIVIGGLFRAGAETQCVNVAIGLKKRGWDVSVISLLKPEAFEIELKDNYIPVYSLNVSKSDSPFKIIYDLRLLLKTLEPASILSFMYHSNILVRMTRLLGVKARFVSSIRGEKFGEGEWTRAGCKVKLRETIFRLTNLLTDVITTNSKHAAEKIIHNNISSARKTIVIPNGINVDNFKARINDPEVLRKELSLESDFIWINVARLQPVKGQKYLIEAFAKHNTSFPDSKLVIVGDGQESENINRQIKSLGLGGSVFLIGERNDIPNLLKSSSVFIFSSLSEGLPNAVIEAHLAELPVVTTRCGGVEEIVENGKTGMVVGIANVDEMVSAMNHIRGMEKKDLEKFGKQGYNNVVKSYDIEKVIILWEDVLTVK